MATQVTDVHVDDWGTYIQATVKEDGVVINISSATIKQIRFKRKDKTTFDRDMEFTTDGTDGKVRYTFQVDELNQAGQWQFQVRVVTPVGGWRSNIKSFNVLANL